MKEFRFGVSLSRIEGAREWAAKCRHAEELGYDVLTIPDHLGVPAPFPALAAAAAATERVRVGTLVLNVPFYNPALLARDVETTMQVTCGRLDLGLGAGVVKAEFDDAGLPWRPAKDRIAYVESTIEELRDRLDEVPPLLIAGNSDGILTVAAKHAAIIGFAGLKQIPGKPSGTFELATPEELDDRVAFVRERAGDVEFNMLIQCVAVAEDPGPSLQEWAAGLATPQTADDLLAAPQILAGTVEQITDRLLAHRKRYSFSYITVFEPYMAAFAPAIQALRGQ